jgi:xanthine dehydrogenase YagS FAD-binding subunit
MTTMTHSEEKEIHRAQKWLSDFWQKPLHPGYCRVTRIEEALALLAQHGQSARIHAGGIDGISLMKHRIIEPEILMNIKPIEVLSGITMQGSQMVIGPLTRIAEIESSELIQRMLPMLSEAAGKIASPQIRNMATVGGNLCQETRCWYYRRSPDTGVTFNCRRKNSEGKCFALTGENQYHAVADIQHCASVCPSDLATVLTAMAAVIEVASPTGVRYVPMPDFYTEFGNCLAPTELMTAIRIPLTDAAARQQFLKFRIRKAIDFAVVSTAVVIKQDPQRQIIDAVRIVMGGVASKPLRAVAAEQCLVGEEMTANRAAEAARVAVSVLRPLKENAYKVPIMRALVKRAILEQ